MREELFIKCGERELLEREYKILMQLNQVEARKKQELSRLFPIVYAYKEEGESATIKIEYIQGKPLNHIINASKAQWIEWMIEVARGMTMLHSLRPAVIWCDCKPENLMIDTQNNIHLVDFNGACFLEKQPLNKTYGTLRYAAPEQRNGERLDQRVDIYAFGKTFLAMPMKRSWFSIHKILRQCIQKEKEKRIQTSGELLYRLKKLEQSKLRIDDV